MKDNPTYKRHHDMFTCFFNSETCELLDPDGMHPFCLASKLNADAYPTFKEILQMDRDSCNKWFNAMDKELQELFMSGTFQFVSRDKVLNQGKEIVQTTWTFWKKCHPSGEVYRFKAHMCMYGDLQCKNFSNNEIFATVVEWATIRMLFSPSIIKGWSTAYRLQECFCSSYPTIAYLLGSSTRICPSQSRCQR